MLDGYIYRSEKDLYFRAAKHNFAFHKAIWQSRMSEKKNRDQI